MKLNENISNLIFEITLRCNSNCMYCYNVWKNPGTYPCGELSTGDIKKLLAKVLKETNAKNVTLTGGELLIRNDIIEIVAFLKELNVKTNIITNGTLLNEFIIEKLVMSGVTNFELPLLSDKRDIHNKLMRMDSFDKVTESIVYIKKNNGIVISVFVATKENIEDFEETAKISLALGADSIMFNRFNPGGEGAKNIKELLPSVSQIKKALRKADNFAEKYGTEIFCSIPIQPCIVDTSEYNNLHFSFCTAGTRSAYYAIDPTGNLRMCNHSRIILGNLFEESFKYLITKKSAEEFVCSYPSFCEECDLKNKCQGGCKASAEVCYGSCKDKEPFLTNNIDMAKPKHFIPIDN